ncbi:uncharacterized protein aff3 isoform X2 [Eucyclogobius newberryi]|uniref:uncharacterized protein aff3 isoform X2 n=1 Tax=Eucyclogobius newberryi TaxID=166745 RepID=UPI003B5B7874
MTQSWVSKQTLGGDNTQRILYKPKDVTQPTIHPRQCHQGDAQLRMSRHPHVAPHKSMLADDLKLSSDEEDSQIVNHDPVWDGHSRSAQRVRSNGRRVRHSSSDSSDTNSSAESSASSHRSQSCSPKACPKNVSPIIAQGPCSSKEIGQPSVAHWQLDKWWRNARKKSSSGEQDPTENIPGYPPSPYAQRSPSSARSWDSNQENSPCQSPISIPHFNYRLTSSPPVPSPGFPSPVPNTSPGSSPRQSPVPSPVLSVCPSPCGSPSASPSKHLYPLPRDPPRSPSPTLPSTRHEQHPGGHSHLRPATQVKKSRSRTWNEHLSNTENKIINTTSSTEKSRLKSRHTQEQNHSRSKTDTNSSQNHKTKPNYFPNSKKVSEIPKSKQTTIHSSKSSKSYQPSFQHNIHINFDAKHSGCEPNNTTGHSSHSKNLNSKPRPTSTPTFVHGLKSSLKILESKEQYNEHVEIEGRQHERNKHSVEENPQGKREKRESRRLAEEQLRRPWIQSSEEDYEEEPTERRTRKEKEHRKRDQHQKHGWHITPNNPKPPTSHHHPEKTDKTKKGQTTISPRDSPTPPSPSPSSIWSSSADSEYQAPITKVPADSTSQKPVRGRARDPSHSDASRSKSAPLQIGIPCEKQGECRQKLYTLVPFGRGEKSAAFSQRGLGNLVVHIDLCLLKRVPDSTIPTAKKPLLHVASATKDNQREAMRHLYVSDAKRKRKMENGVSHKESKRGIPYANECSGPADDNHILTETTHSGPIDEYLDSKRPLSPVSPIADSPEFIKPGSQIKTSEKNREKNRDAAVKPKVEVESHKCSQSTKPTVESWGPSGHRGTVTLPDTQHHAEYYLHEAKRMKHRADAMVDKLGKAVNYVDAALSFMECGKAMEQGPLEAKSPYTMYTETVELIRYAMRLKSHSGPGARQEDKQLAVLCFRCLALLYWQMFRLKKDHALKYSKVLLDYFKTSSKVPASAPCWNGSGKSPGGHPTSLSPNAKNRSWSSHGGNTSSSFINIPHRIHQMAANHLNITNSVLYSYEYWEVADNLAKENIEFFNYLNTLSGPLTLHSSIAHAVQYTRQALQWIRISAKLN